MKQSDFQHYSLKIIKKLVLPLLETKGNHYSNTNAFDNFTEGGSMTGLSPSKYLMTLANKHWFSLLNNQTDVRERAVDIIIYMLLLIAYDDEQRDNQGVKNAMLE